MASNGLAGAGWWRRPTVALVGLLFVLTVASVAVAAAVWPTVGSSGSRSNAIFGAAIQVIGVAVVGGVVAFVFAALKEQYATTLSARDKVLERLREDFEIRADLIKRTASCAQRMYVTCQHVARLQRWQVDDETLGAGMARLHETYLSFSPDAAAIETELEARFGATSDAEAADPDPLTGGASERSGENITTPLVGELADGPAALWHQVWDLVTIYYFALDQRFPGDVLAANSTGTDGRLHSGLQLDRMVRDHGHPTADELRVIRKSVRKTFVPAQRALGTSIRRNPLLED